MCSGKYSDEIKPSPKSQKYCTIDPVEELGSKLTFNGTCPALGLAVKSASTSSCLTEITYSDEACLPVDVTTVNFIVNTPMFVNS